MGTNFFPSRRRHCEGCCQRKVHVGREQVTEYYHRGVFAHLIGFDIPVVLDVEMIAPGEGEVVAARRLFERLLRHYGRFFDAVVGDALYLEGPFFNLVTRRGKHALAVLKANNPALLEDARGIFRDPPHLNWREPKRSVQCWDAEGFTSAHGIDAPLRVLHTQETETLRQRIAGRWVVKTETHSWWWATTIDVELMPARQVARAGHRRWDIENKLFNTLATHWALDHCFRHDPVAILNFVLTLMIAFVMIQCFYHRNLKTPLRGRFTLIAVAAQLHLGLAAMVGWRAPWLEGRSGAPP